MMGRLSVTVFSLSLLFTLSTIRAQNASPVASASTILARAISAFSGGTATHSVSLNGSVHVYEGASTETGTASLAANSDGSNSVQLQLSGGNRSEVVTACGSGRSCSWSGEDGVVHDEANGNCWTAIVWFLPQISLQPGGISSAVGTQYLGLDANANGSFHVIKNQIVVGPGKTPLAVTQQIAQQSTTTLRIDPSNLLPSVLDYRILSDSGSTSIDVEVRYSNYGQLSGLTVPTHIERYLNGSLQLSIDISQAAVLN